jgi:pSer/pThr/pTyr-binding forkhead associated (FHA) protein
MRSNEIVISSHSVSPKHAVLIRSEGGSVRLADLGSESGTWVNFAPVSSKGAILNHGDLVQIGKLSFRYQIGGSREGKNAK